MVVKTLLSSIATTTNGNAILLSAENVALGPIAIQVITNTNWNGTIKLQGTLSTEANVTADTANWSDISGGVWTSSICDALYCQYKAIRAIVSSYTLGTISVKVLV